MRVKESCTVGDVSLDGGEAAFALFALFAVILSWFVPCGLIG